MAHAVERIPGFVHRDLKPENVLVGADRLPGTTLSQIGVNRVRVTDFGLATVLQKARGRISEEVGKQEGETARSGYRTLLTEGGIFGTNTEKAEEK